jgi:glycosyltransferase involved in cell wall biosynthesis
VSDLPAIAFLSHVASPDAPTGAERSLVHLARGMRRRGHRTLIVAPGEWALADTVRDGDVELEVVPSSACWLTYHDPRPWPVATAKWAKWLVSSGASTRIAGVLERWKPDVVHVNCLPHLSGAAAATATGRPVVWHLREILPAGRRRAWFAEKLARHATSIVAVSEAVGEWVRAEGLGDRLTVVPNGVDASPSTNGTGGMDARRSLGLPEEGVLAGLFGQLVPHKGAMEFVEAASVAARIEPSLRFVLAGSGPDEFRREVEQAIADRGLADRFHVLPPQPTGDTLVRAADIVCLATTTPDPFPRAVLEAMAAAKPVATFASGGTGEMVLDGQTGLIVPSGDAQALGRAVARLGGDAGLRSEFGAAGRRRAKEEFSMARHLDRMETLFSGLAA